MRVFIYVQGLIGSGHLVRSGEIARALAKHHEVWLLDGGRPIPRHSFPDKIHLVQPPRIRRKGPGLIPMNSDLPIDQVMELRRQQLLNTIVQVKPDVLLIEHFPISKWLLYDEIIALIETVRMHHSTKVICSLRDYSPLHFYDANPTNHKYRTQQTLEDYFDHLLIHGDPQFVTQLDNASWAEGLSIPANYTGFVSQKPQMPIPGDASVAKRGEAVVSVGGAGDASLAYAAIAAWKHMESKGLSGDRTLTVFLPLETNQQELEQLHRAGQGCRLQFEPFAVDFLDRLEKAELSISHAGYNTCMNLLETNTRCVLVPSSVIHDQLPRAKRMVELGLAQMLEQSELQPESLADAIYRALKNPKLSHRFDLNGADQTRQLIESIHSNTLSATA